MALSHADDPLDKAVRALRRTSHPGWIELPEQIMATVRSMVLHDEPILTFPTDPPADGSRTWVSSRVVTTALRLHVGERDMALSDVSLTLDQDRLARVDLETVGSYGVDLIAAGAGVIARARSALDDLGLGDPHRGYEIFVRVVDVVVGDPYR